MSKHGHVNGVVVDRPQICYESILHYPWYLARPLILSHAALAPSHLPFATHGAS